MVETLPPSELIAGDGAPIAREFIATAQAMTPEAKESARAYLAPHVETFCRMLVRGVENRDRTAMNLFPRVLGLIGASEDVARSMLAQLGVQSLDVARKTLELARDAQVMDSESLYEKSLSYVMEYRRRNGLPPLIEQQTNRVEVVE